MNLVRQVNREWRNSGIPGIEICPTWNGAGGDGGYFARFQAGARFPKHAHQGWEQIYVVEGAIRFNDVDLRAGDILQVEGSDEHEAQALEETLLFVAHHGGIDILE
ncbi:cupin domain-containing protein [Massilia sp. SR12]